MQFEYTDKVAELLSRVEGLMDQHIYPNEEAYYDFVHDPANQWQEWPGMEALKEKARSAGLWNLFLPHEYGAFSPGLTNLEYAPLAEVMGASPLPARCSTALRRIRATWKCWPNMVRQNSRSTG